MGEIHINNNVVQIYGSHDYKYGNEILETDENNNNLVYIKSNKNTTEYPILSNKAIALKNSNVRLNHHIDDDFGEDNSDDIFYDDDVFYDDISNPVYQEPHKYLSSFLPEGDDRLTMGDATNMDVERQEVDVNSNYKIKKKRSFKKISLKRKKSFEEKKQQSNPTNIDDVTDDEFNDALYKRNLQNRSYRFSSFLSPVPEQQEIKPYVIPDTYFANQEVIAIDIQTKHDKKSSFKAPRRDSDSFHPYLVSDGEDNVEVILNKTRPLHYELSMKYECRSYVSKCKDKTDGNNKQNQINKQKEIYSRLIKLGICFFVILPFAIALIVVVVLLSKD